uniref:Uncharacterized protein n=1 Tax=Amphilophus citrinellus TaxID=61819 RepID=A0A3Q0RAY2_AMPCI
MPLAQIAEPWPTMELVQLETEACLTRSLNLFTACLWSENFSHSTFLFLCLCLNSIL